MFSLGTHFSILMQCKWEGKSVLKAKIIVTIKPFVEGYSVQLQRKVRRETWCLSSSLYPIINNFSPSSFVPWNVHLRKMSVTFFSENTYHRLWIIKRSREPKNIYSELIGKTVQAFKTDLMISTIIFSVSPWFLQARPQLVTAAAPDGPCKETIDLSVCSELRRCTVIPRPPDLGQK